ncbi:DUF3696 domain-containing protein [Micromonospora echinaurantiaca]|uniref:DUF3696 domain-containing protein n=1 Tax=Micromonospora echinaurantiaca TaxID=47857 RepID=UPI003794DA36
MIDGAEPRRQSAEALLSWPLLEAVRGIGIERGADLVLEVLFVRWTTAAMRHPAKGAWSELALASPERKAELLPRLFPFDDTDGWRVDRSDSFCLALEELVKIVDRLDTADLDGLLRTVAVTYDAVLDALEDRGGHSKAEFAEFTTPRSVAELLAALTVEAGDDVHDPACGSGNILLAAHASAPNVRVTGNDANARAALRARMRLYIHDVYQWINVGDAFEEFAPSSADVVLAQPPWGLRKEYDSKRLFARYLQGSEAASRPAVTQPGDLTWLALALGTLRRGGRAAVVLTPNSVFPPHTASQEELLARDAVEAIISLPGGLFRHTVVPTVIWLLRNTATKNCRNKVLFIDAESTIEATGKGELELPPQAIGKLASLVRRYRQTGIVDADGFLARIVPTIDIDCRKGLHPRRFLDDPPPEAVTHPAPERTMLTQIQIANFKAFGPNGTIDLAPLTLLYGANSAGKSSVIQAMLLLKQSMARDGLVTQGSLANAGGFPAVVHQHAAAWVRLGLTYGVLPSWLPPEGTVNPTLPRTVDWSFATGALAPGALHTTRFAFGSHVLQFDADEDLLRADLEHAAELFRDIGSGALIYPFSEDRARGDIAKRQRNQENNARRALRALRTGGSDLPLRRHGLLPGPEPLLSRSLQVMPGFQDHNLATAYAGRVARIASGISTEVQQLLESLVWLGPLRSAPRRVYDRTSTGSDPGDGMHTAMFLFDHVSAVEQVNEWMARLEVPYSMEVVPLNSGYAADLVGDLVTIVLTDQRSGVRVTPADVGFGISQILPIVVELLSRRESIIMIEQPETHLHPRLQSRIADLFIETAQAGGRGNQLIIETHSEHIVLRLQRRIREGVLDASDVAVIYIDQDDRGRAVVHRLRLDSEGNFVDEWPHGFFDERLDDMFGAF